MSFHSAQRRGFTKGSLQQVYKCRICKRSTRPTGTGDNDGVKLCVECYDLAGEENHLSDTGTFYDSKARILDNIAAIEAKGGDVSSWADLKLKASQ